MTRASRPADGGSWTTVNMPSPAFRCRLRQSGAGHPAMDAKLAAAPFRYPAALYEAVHRGNPGDVDYYRRVCAGAQRVLELGCGTGRVAHALARDGVEVIGIDGQAGLLARGREGPATLLEDDMIQFELGRRFERIVIPYNGLYCLPDREQQRCCLERCRTHLAPEGLVVFDGYAADRFHAEDPDPETLEDELEHVTTVRTDGSLWDVYEQSLWERGKQRLIARYVHVPRQRGDPVEGVIPQRYLLSEEVAPLLEEAGLQLIALQGGFDQSAFDPETSELLIVIACRDDVY